MKKLNLDRAHAFISLTHQVQDVQRIIFAGKTKRMENDAEHQYQLAMVAWYLNDSLEMGLDTHKIVQYSLIHDFVEVYAGDVFFYDEKKNEHDKHAREMEAAQRLKNEFPEFNELHEMIDAYEKREDPESRFVYALDKLLPIWNIQLDNGQTWKQFGITLEKLIAKKTPKIETHPAVKEWFEETVEQLRKDEEKLFTRTNENIQN